MAKRGNIRWTRTAIIPALLSLFALLASLVPLASLADSDKPCDDRNKSRQAYFGDVHIHTGVSADAMIFGTTNRPVDAYAFARGGSVEIFRSMISSDQPMQIALERPLDFAAVTDHSENIGTVSLCLNPESPVYQTKSCQFVRTPLPSDSMASFSTALTKVFQTMYFSEEICGADRKRCIDAVQQPWQEIQAAANEWNSPCEFTTLIGYEYSPTEGGSNLHHNVLFESDVVTDAPISSRDVPNPFDMYQQLKSQCNDQQNGCRALVIPHNSNISNGKMFTLNYPGDGSRDSVSAMARLRAEMVPLVEIFQEKGDSECRNGLWNIIGQPDEYCDFEKYRDWQGEKHEDCKAGIGNGGFQNKGCVSRLDYTRYALAAGLEEQRRIGVNSLKFGVVAATDNHLGIAADLEEWTNDGVQRPYSLVEPGRMSTGGLAGVWARENTRESIFGAMSRRETFATSGTRIRPRLFAAWEFGAKDMCSDPKALELAYQQGVPMGGELSTQGKQKSPEFFATALADPGTELNPGTALQRLQIVKVWAGKNSELHQAVYDLAIAQGSDAASVNTENCQTSGQGAVRLCATWRDPDFDASQSAAYYVRALENPSCRHTAYSCMPGVADPLPEFCSDASIPKIIQERAWTSPVWLTATPDSTD